MASVGRGHGRGRVFFRGGVVCDLWEEEEGRSLYENLVAELDSVVVEEGGSAWGNSGVVEGGWGEYAFDGEGGILIYNTK